MSLTLFINLMSEKPKQIQFLGFGKIDRFEFIVEVNSRCIPSEHRPLHVVSLEFDTIIGHSFPQRCAKTSMTIGLLDEEILQVEADTRFKIVNRVIDGKSNRLILLV